MLLDDITLRYDNLYLRMPKSWCVASLICHMEPKKTRGNEEN